MTKIKSIVFKLDNDQETTVSPCYESWEQWGDIMLDTIMLDELFGVLKDYKAFNGDVEN